MGLRKAGWVRFFGHLSIAFYTLSVVAASGENLIKLNNESISLEVYPRGGSLVGLRLTGQDLNPLSWRASPELMPNSAHSNALFQGHFLCMGRLGQPTKGEREAGVPMRGEQTGKIWSVEHLDIRSVAMSCAAPLDGLNVERRIQLNESENCFLVTEAFKNTGSLGRLNNILQHVTIGPPFLSRDTLINCNGIQGVNHKFRLPDPHRHEFMFPIARLDKDGRETTDLRSSSDPVNYLNILLIDSASEYGWVTAYDAGSGLVLGYVWKRTDYPWLSLWQQSKKGMISAKGLEFGTAGIDAPYRVLLRDEIRFHGVPSWEYIDAGETIEKSYVCFLINIGKGQPNPTLRIEQNRFLLNEVIGVPNLFIP